MSRQHRLLFKFLAVSFAGCIALGDTVICRANITIDTVPIGNPGNANDPATGSHYGGVAYNFAIGKYDVTVGQYTAFLNAVAGVDSFGLYSPSMATDTSTAGIARSGVSGYYSYSVIGSPDQPVTYVNWGDAARFCNWLNNGQPGLGGHAVPQDGDSTENGAYTLYTATTDAALNAVTRNVAAKWFIPSESEWYKAAFYDPATAHYWAYATGTNTPPTSAPPGNVGNTANFLGPGGHSAVDGPNHLTDVGAYAASPSSYGTFDQSGDVFQWTEGLDGVYRHLRGGSWEDGPDYLRAAVWNISYPTREYGNFGFRVAASVPEPSTATLAIVAYAMVCWRRIRLRA